MSLTPWYRVKLLMFARTLIGKYRIPVFTELLTSFTLRFWCHIFILSYVIFKRTGSSVFITYWHWVFRPCSFPSLVLLACFLHCRGFHGQVFWNNLLRPYKQQLKWKNSKLWNHNNIALPIKLSSRNTKLPLVFHFSLPSAYVFLLSSFI